MLTALAHSHLSRIPTLLQGRVPLLNPRRRTHYPRQPRQLPTSWMLRATRLSFRLGALVGVDVVLPAGAGLVGVGEARVVGSGGEGFGSD